MKRLNFLNQKHFSYLFISITLLAICFSLFFSFSTASASAMTSNINTKLLIILDDSKQKPSFPDEYNDIVEYVYLSDVSMSDNTHIAYAVTKEIAQNEYVNPILKYAYMENDARIYIYGNLTISEFKNIMDIDTYSVLTDIYDENGVIGETAKMSFSKEQEDNKVEQVISLSQNAQYQSLIASVPNATSEILETIIVSHYADTFVNPMTYATIVKNGFNYRTYANFYSDPVSPLDFAYLNIDYYLYKIEEEAIANYDYFAIRVNVNPICENTALRWVCEDFQVKLSLPKTNDHIYEYGPYSTNKANNISVQLGFGASGVSGSVGFTFAPGSKPDIKTSFNSTDRTILWKVDRHWFFGASLNNKLYPFGASWASAGRYAAINISSYVNFAYDHKSSWNDIQVRYSY